MQCVSDWSKSKISPRLNIETIKKRMSFTTLPLYFDDVKVDTFLSKVTEGFDGDVYETKEVGFINKIYLIKSQNLPINIPIATQRFVKFSKPLI